MLVQKKTSVEKQEVHKGQCLHVIFHSSKSDMCTDLLSLLISCGYEGSKLCKKMCVNFFLQQLPPS